MEPIPEKLLGYSRRLRHDQTPWEEKLWYYVRAKRFFGLKFKRQVRLGHWIVDFYCSNRRLVIELDGSQHATDEVALQDNRKVEYLQQQGMTVVRFWNNQLDKNIEGVLAAIQAAAGVTTSPQPSPRQERGMKRYG